MVGKHSLDHLQESEEKNLPIFISSQNQHYNTVGSCEMKMGCKK